MVIAYAVFDLHLPGCRGLKEKRMIVKSLKSRIRNEFEVSAAEVGDNDLLQRAQIGRGRCRDRTSRPWTPCSRRSSSFVERNLDGRSSSYQNEFLHV